MKKTLVISIILIMSMTLPSFAESEYTDYAEKLKMIGVFAGTDSGFELDREPTRLEGLIMFIRLLGAESKTTSGQFNHPFTDVPQWANGYVGWAYENGYTKGIAPTEFGVGNIDAKSYLTFMLRALGYNDLSGDFTWNESIKISKQVGIISENDVDKYKESKFLRDHVAKISFDVLSVEKKEGVQLGKYLVQQGSVEKGILEAMGISEIGNGSADTVNQKYDSDIFFMREFEDLEIAEVIKGSTRASYDQSLHASKILKHGQSNSLYSEEFESNLNGLKIVRGFLFDDEIKENLGSVNLRNSGLLVGTSAGEYYVDDYLKYILNEPFSYHAEDSSRYIGLDANYVNDETFSISIEIGIGSYMDQNMQKLVKELIKNITSNNQNSEEISNFIVTEISTWLDPENNVKKFDEILDDRRYYTEMYVDGYYLEFYQSSVPSLGIKIR